MEISVDVQIRSIYLSAKQQGLATASYTRSALRPEFLSQISGFKYPWQPQKTLSIHENTLKKMIIKYSEQSVYRPLEEIKYWFAYSSGAFIEPGYPPLFYGKDKNKSISPNISAVASVGEGIAGFLAQRLYKCRKLARPNHDFPDIVMENDSYDKTYLVESKATISSKVNSDPFEVQEKAKYKIDDELPRLAAYASSCLQLDNRPVVGILVSTALLRETNYFCYIAEVIL
jgi:hypothetical protein